VASERTKRGKVQQVREQQNNEPAADTSNGNNKTGNTFLNKRVLIFIPSIGGQISLATAEGLMQLLWDCWKWREKGWEFVPYFGHRMSLPSVRNEAVKMAIEAGFDYILWMDDDMVIPVGEEIFSRLINHDKDIVAPLFFVRSKPYLPLLFKRVTFANGAMITYENILDYPKNTLVKCDGVGFGFIITKVEVFKKMKQPYFAYSDQYGEDLRFCEEASKVGAEIYCDTSLQVGHIAQPEVIFEEHFNREKPGAELFMKQKMDNCEKKAEEISLKADLILPCYKNVEITKECVSSILNNTEGVNYRIIAVNDGADKQLRKYFAELQKFRKNIVYLESKTQQGASASVNLALDNVKSAYVVLLNNDIIIPPNMTLWLYRFLTKLMLEPELGAVGCTSNNIFGIQNTMYNSMYALPEHYVKVLIPLCMAVKREVFEKVGKFDERFTLPNKIGLNQDLDMSIRIRQAGYKMKCMRDIFIEHIGQHTQSQCGNLDEAEKITRDMLIEKWGKPVVDEITTLIEDRQFLYKGE
jgi:GT2 family glycosyltransferase